MKLCPWHESVVEAIAADVPDDEQAVAASAAALARSCEDCES